MFWYLLGVVGVLMFVISSIIDSDEVSSLTTIIQYLTILVQLIFIYFIGKMLATNRHIVNDEYIVCIPKTC